MSVEEARSKARDVLRQCRNGELPSRKVPQDLPTLREAYIAYCKTTGIKPSSHRRYESFYRTHFGPWLDQPVDHMGHGAFAEHYHDFAQNTGKSLVELGRGVIGAVIKYVNAVYGLNIQSPFVRLGAAGLLPERTQPRARVLQESELPHWREAVDKLGQRPVMWTRSRKTMKTTPDKFVTYYRVSTQRQGASGFGLDAQLQTVAQYLAGAHRTTVGEFLEVETGKGAVPLSKRPQLRLALEMCKKTGATLLIAKLDRLARNVHFVSELIESKVSFVACDLPEANQLTIHIMAAFAEHEARRISERTRDALAAAKARGVVLGATGPANVRTCNDQRQQRAQEFRERLRPVLDGMVAQGLTHRAMVERLNALGIKASMGSAWSLGQVQRLVSFG